MHYSTLTALSVLSLTGSVFARHPPTDEVPLLGPSFLSNFDPANAKSIKDAADRFPSVMDQLFEDKELNKTDLIFSVDVFSAASNESIYQYTHVGEGLDKTLTAGKLTDKTVGRLGSVTKLITVYSIIAKAGFEVLSHPVTKYLPELSCNSTQTTQSLRRISWDDVTVGTLASHQVGSGGFGAFLNSQFAKGVEDPSVEDMLDYMRDVKHPVIAPYEKAIYSDAGFAMLGEVLARLSGKKYNEAVNEIIAKPLGIKSLTTHPPTGDDVDVINRTVIDPASAWPLDISVAGGRWMKPMSGTGSLVELVGAPWEIHRLAIPATPGSKHTRISDLYTKAGGNVDYNCIFALSPDHGIGYSILLAGSTSATARFTVRDAVGDLFIPAAETAAFENAEKNLAGTFIGNSTNTNITLTVDDDHPGIGIESLYMNGVESTALILGATEPAPINASVRLYPTGLNSEPGTLNSLYKTDGTMKIPHRSVGRSLPLTPRAVTEGGKGTLFDSQGSWMTIDFESTVDEFIFTIKDGELTSIESTGLWLTFKRA